MDQKDETVRVEENKAAHRFEARIGDYLAVAEYRRVGDTITFTHTEVPKLLEGRRIASSLARTALEQAQAQQLTVIPQCPFFASYIRRHPEYAPLVLSTYHAHPATE
ncbi:MAG: GNAT family N-acetyltransferase [Thermomicrobiales bacterium]